MSSNPRTVKRKERKCNTTNYSLIWIKCKLLLSASHPLGYFKRKTLT
jgi:hypothetical protein